MSIKITRPQIREVFLRNGAHIEPGHDDLPDYVYESVFELMELAAPAVQGEPDQARLRERFDEIEREICEGKHTASSVFTQMRTAAFYTAPPPAEQQPAPDVAVQGEPESSGLYAVYLRDNWDGEGDTYWIFARKQDNGVWVSEDSGKELIEHEGDALLKVVPLVAAPQPAEQKPVYQRCEYCDGTGDVHSIDGEWRGACDCQKPAPDAIELDPKDLIVQLWSSRGRSQWDCSLERGVKITHVPSGTSVTCDTERSMHANKNKALCKLQSQLAVNPAPDVAGLVNALEGLLGVIGESRGVSGYHLNGEIAEWDEFQEVHDATAFLAAHRKGGE